MKAMVTTKGMEIRSFPWLDQSSQPAQVRATRPPFINSIKCGRSGRKKKNWGKALKQPANKAENNSQRSAAIRLDRPRKTPAIRRAQSRGPEGRFEPREAVSRWS